MTHHSFRGLLCYLDQPSEKAPAGSRGHRVELTRAAAEEALSTLIGTPINACEETFDTHDTRNLKGEIQDAWIQEDQVWVRGLVTGVEDTPLEPGHPLHAALGMSYELTNAHIEDMRAKVWRVTKLQQFTGAAVLYRSKAAYQRSRFTVCR